MNQPPKVRLTSRAVAVLTAMHAGEIPKRDPKGRAELFNAGLCCYVDSWQLTKNGKQIARHLTGRV